MLAALAAVIGPISGCAAHEQPDRNPLATAPPATAPPSCPTAAPSPADPTRAGTDCQTRPRSPAQPRLVALAEAITDAPPDASTTANARYTFHHIRRWLLDTTGTPARAGMRENTPAVFAIDIQRWQARDGSGRELLVETPPDYTLAGADPAYLSTKPSTDLSADPVFAGARPDRTDYPPGHQRSAIAGPPATEPAELARQLAVDPIPDGPQALVRAVDELYTDFYITLATRRAALRVLAGVHGLTYHDAMTDRLGRSGSAVSLVADGVEYTLIFDRTTGRLLASQQRSLGAHQYLDHLNVPHGLVRYYTLFIDQGLRDELN